MNKVVLLPVLAVPVLAFAGLSATEETMPPVQTEIRKELHVDPQPVPDSYVASSSPTLPKDQLGEGIATLLNLQGKLCARVMSVEDRGTTKAITCQEYRNDPTSRVVHVIQK